MARDTNLSIAAGPLPVAADFQIKLLGRFGLRWRGASIEIKSRKSRALLGYLALSEALTESRERLVGMLWSEVDEGRARQSLRQSLYEIRQALSVAGVDGMVTDRLVVGLTMAGADVDVLRVVEEARVGRPGLILAECDQVFDTLLCEFETIDPAFRTWLLPRRRSLELRVADLLERHLREGKLPPARLEANARALLRLDPSNEVAIRTVMSARAAAGDVGGALRHYKDFWSLLDQEYGQEPSQPTQDLAVAIKMQSFAAPLASSGATVAEPAPQVVPLTSALLPRRNNPQRLAVSIGDFDVAAVAAERRYLVQGFRRELIAMLVRFREWAVRDAIGMSQGPAGSAQPSQPAIRLDGHAVDGSGAIRLVLTMQQSETSEYTWSDEILLSLDTWDKAQQMVLRRLASALQVNISAGRMAAMRRQDLSDPLAYDLWLRGQEKVLSWQPQAWAEAAVIFEQIMAMAPGYALAYSSLAQLDNTMHFAHPGLPRDPVRAARAIANATQATRIDPLDARGHLHLGWAQLMADQFDRAAEHARLALELNDTDQLTALSTAQILSFCGHHETAVDLVSRAERIFPYFTRLQWAHVLGIRFLAGDYAGAVAASQVERTLIPTLTGFRIAALHHLGEWSQAREEREDYIASLRARWAVPGPCDDHQVRDWFLSATPLRLRSDWKRLRDGFDGR